MEGAVGAYWGVVKRAIGKWGIERWVSPLTSRLLLVNCLPLLFLGGMLLSINSARNNLLERSIDALREQARMYAAALQMADSGIVRHGVEWIDVEKAQAVLVPMVQSSKDEQVRLYAPNGHMLVEGKTRDFTSAGRQWQPTLGVADKIYEWVLSLLPLRSGEGVVPLDNSAHAEEYGQDTQEDVQLSPRHELPPYIRRTAQHELIMTVVEPVLRERKAIAVLQLTRYDSEIDRSLVKMRSVILTMLVISMVGALGLSWYFSMILARPLRCLVVRSREMREPGRGRVDNFPLSLLKRRDEIGELARALRGSALALWSRMDDIETFASEVSHELKNPLSSIRSALDTLPRMTDPQARQRLVDILRGDVRRLGRLITDISDASRVEGDLQRGERAAVAVVPLLELLVELHQTTRDEQAVNLVLSLPDAVEERAVYVLAVEDRLVQVLHNLIGNAVSFSPPQGTIILKVRTVIGPSQLTADGMTKEGGPFVEISVEDEGPGIPPAKLEDIFERFYSERPAKEHFGQHSGLGLAISRQIITAFDGYLYAENRYKRDELTGGEIICGARFVIKLPQYEGEGEGALKFKRH